jgi:type IV pilus assembly protein PilV
MREDLTMRNPLPHRDQQEGVMLIEALIAILIFSIGILAVVGMQGIAIKGVTESKSRSDAALLANELIAQMWADQGNIAQYNYPGSGTVPGRLGTISPPAGWIGRVMKLPGAASVLPRVTVPAPGTPAATVSGATVQIQVFWQLPEEASLGLPPHDYTVIVSIFL